MTLRFSTSQTPAPAVSNTAHLAELNLLDACEGVIHRAVKKGAAQAECYGEHLVATSVSMDILLMDEWLSVGDVDFKKQAEERMKHIVERTGILVLASHSPGLIQRECNRVVELSHGRCVRDEPLLGQVARSSG